MNNSNRIYRKVSPSDLTKISSGALKVLYKSGDGYFPAKFLSVRMYSARRGASAPPLCVGYLISFPSYDVVVTDGDSNEFYIDVTPEQRFLIWDLKIQRFISIARDGFSGCKTEGEAQAVIVEHCRVYNQPTTRFKVIPFEYPGEQE